MRILALFLTFLTLPALGCMGPVGPEEIREDVGRQAKMTEEIARSADRVLIGEMVWVSESRTSARFRISETIKGEALEDEIQLDLEDNARVVIACQAWRMFRNVYFYQGEEFIIYISDGDLLRTGLTKRINWDIELEREISIVRRVANNT